MQFTREQLIALGFDPDKAITAMNSDPAKNKVINQAPKIPLRNPEDIPVEALVAEQIPIPQQAKPAVKPIIPKIESPSFADKQADAMAALDVMNEQEKAAPAPIQMPSIPEKAKPQDDMIAKYMDMMRQLKEEEKAGLSKAQESLEDARGRDKWANVVAGLTHAITSAHGSKTNKEDIYSGGILKNAEKDYSDLLNQYRTKKSDIGADLGNLGTLQKLRGGESDFESSEKLRSPQSEVSQLYRDAYRKSNPDIPISDDLSAEDVSKLLQKQKSSGGITPYQEKMLQLTERKLDISDRRADQADKTQGRLQEQFGWNKQQKDELSEKLSTHIADNKTTIDNLEKIKTDPELLKVAGPLKGRFQEYKRLVGMDDPRASAMQADIVDTISGYIKSRSGTAVSDKEREFLMGALPNIMDNPATLKQVITQMQTRIARDTKSTLDYQRPIRDVSQYDKLYEQDFKKFEHHADPRVEQFMKKNNIQDKEQAIEILRKAGKL